jgi:hypothetical protein
MRLLVVVLLTIVIVPVLAQEPRKRDDPRPEWVIQMERMDEIAAHAWLVRPQRRDAPLRELNISDSEVREIETIAAKYAMNSMLNISPVVAGCPCEEGPLCTDQVFVVSNTPSKTVGLQLSRVRAAWVVGTVQQWWLRYAELLEKEPKMDRREFHSLRNQLLLEFPVCPLKKPESGSATTAQAREATK